MLKTEMKSFKYIIKNKKRNFPFDHIAHAKWYPFFASWRYSWVWQGTQWVFPKAFVLTSAK